MVFNYFLLVACLSLRPTELPSAQTIISNSIKYHDPNNNWRRLQARLNFVETRPNGDDRLTSVIIDNTNGNVCLEQNVNKINVQRHIIKDSCLYSTGENKKLTDKEIEEFKLNDKNTLFLRNYYLYLWGLPMKLNDAGTIIDNEAKLAKFNGKEGYKVKVSYDAKTGSDTWFFYFDPETYALIGYKFYHNLEKRDGEYITLEGNEMVFGIKIPKTRSWYTNQDSTFLGTDILKSVGSSLHKHN